jgi:hypothetical protein
LITGVETIRRSKKEAKTGGRTSQNSSSTHSGE